VVVGEEGEDLRGFAVFELSEAYTAVGDEGHGGIICGDWGALEWSGGVTGWAG
jgi:hypothetical protein